jgi:hypothetical protein
VLGYTSRLFAHNDTIPAPLAKNPRPISYYLTYNNFGMTTPELWRIQVLHDCTSLVKGLEFKELWENLDIAYLEDIQALIRARYGYSNPNPSEHDTLSVPLHWRNEEGDVMKPYGSNQLSCFIGSCQLLRLLPQFQLWVFSRYVQYIEINGSISKIPDWVHDWNNNFNTSRMYIHMEIRTWEFTTM